MLKDDSGKIGQAVSRVEGRKKVTGTAEYPADTALENLAYAAVVQSTIAKGRLKLIHTEAARNAPGVLAVLTHLNMPRLNSAPVAISNDGGSGAAGENFLPLQDEIIYFNGQHIAVVIAETWEQASRATTLIRVEYVEEQANLDMVAALPTAVAPKRVWGSPPDTNQGDVRQGLAEAEVQLDQTYITQMQNHNAMELHATIAKWDAGDKLTLYEPSTWVDGVRNTVAIWLGLSKENVRVISRFVGGSFGFKGPTWPHVVLAAVAARQVNRPVKLLLTRAQEFTLVGYRPVIQQQIQLGATKEGKLLAVVHDAFAQTAPFDDRVVAPVTKTTRKLYACPNIKTSYKIVRLNMSGPFTMRGPGETPGLFAVESAMDELAYKLNLDPIELRLRNYAEVDPETGKPWSSKSLRECYQQGAARFGWEKRNPQPRSMRDGDELIGFGMATMAYDARFSPASARACLDSQGNLLVQSATADQGTGSYTAMSQIAAETMAMPLAKVRFELGDTELPEAPISAGSRTTASVGTAVLQATAQLRQKLLELAISQPNSVLYQQNSTAIKAANGNFYLSNDPTKNLAYSDVLKLHQLDKLEVTVQAKLDAQAEKFTNYSFGAHFAEVRVRPQSGELRVSRYVGAFAAGRIVNPKTARSQLIGGIIWGLGMALMEETRVDERFGRVVNSNLSDYLVPTIADIPPIEAFFIEENDPNVNPLGVKGIGEVGTIGAAAAVANAVYHATGIRFRDLPITPDKLLS